MPQYDSRHVRPLIVVAMLIGVAIILAGSVAHAIGEEALVALNAGGDELVTSSGTTFAADTTSPAAVAFFSGGRSRSVDGTVAGTTDPDLYSTVRAGSQFAFTATGLSPATYEISFHFVEAEPLRPDRTFDVAVEGDVVLDDFDVFAAAGGTLVAHVETVTADVADGTLDVDFAATSGRAAVAAISVTALDGAPSVLTAAPASLDFGTVDIGTTSSATVAITNNGSNDIALVSAEPSGDAFELVSPQFPVTVVPADAVTLAIEFSPGEPGEHVGEVVVTTDDPLQPTLSVPLSGNGVRAGSGPDIAVDPGALDFGESTLGAVVERSVAISNTGAGDLTLDGVSADATGYSVAFSGPTTIGPGGTLTVSVTFRPVSARDGGGSLVISSDDPDEPVVSLPIAAAVVPFPAQSVAVVGCSNTQQHIAGYLDSSDIDQLAPVRDLGGGSLAKWAAFVPEFWAIYDESRPAGGYEAAWVQVCLRAGEIDHDLEAEVTAVVDEIVARDGDIPIVVSPLNLYVDGHVCDATGADGPATAAALADWSVENLGTLRGPDTGPLGPEELRRDGCHLNDAGIGLVGDQLVVHFDPS